MIVLHETDFLQPTSSWQTLNRVFCYFIAEMTNNFWVNNDYINEFTVLLAWCVALIPWNIQYVTLPEFGRMVFVRFPFFQIRYQLGFELGQQNLLLSPLGALNYQAGNPMADPYTWWVIAAAPLGLSFLLATSMYILDIDDFPVSIEDVQTKLPVPLARMMGGLFALGTAALTGATYLLFTTGFQDVNVPIGILFLGIFSYILLTNPVVDK